MCKKFEQLLVTHCAPTLANIKTANLFCCGLPRETLLSAVRFWNKKFRSAGVHILLLKPCPHSGRHLVYVYRQARLRHDLMRPDAAALLHAEGYPDTESLLQLLSFLAQRLRSNADFPHEIGLFLGYPAADVSGFITHKGKNYCCSGIWKAYTNPKQAQRCFDAYRCCAQTYQRHYKKGKTILQLTLAA